MEQWSSRYYRNRIKDLIDKNFLRLVLGKLGIQYVQALNFGYNKCNAELETILRKELTNANFCVVDLENYIDKERRYY